MSDTGMQVFEVGLGSVAVTTGAIFTALGQDATVPAWGVRKEPEKIQAGGTTEVELIYWGEDNKLPQQLVEAVGNDPVISSNMKFNITSMYGDGVRPMMRRVEESGEVRLVPCTDERVLAFFERHLNFTPYFLEQCTDLSHFYNTCCQLSINESREVVRLQHLEMGYARFSRKVDGYSPYIAYDDLFGDDDYDPKNTVLIDALNPSDPIGDIQEKLGLLPNATGKTQDTGIRLFGLRIVFPTPFKQYYSRPYYTSIFNSGWSEFSRLIVQFKKAILKNQATIKYKVTFHPDYFNELFRLEAITTREKQRERVREEFVKINKYLSGVDNAGKAMQDVGIVVKDTLISKIRIEVVDDHFKGGEYLEDSEEVANILCYAMGVHPSIIGAAPGKGKSISGTEARELMLIKNALSKPERDLLLIPFYIVKALNGWPPELVFEIPYTVLTTLDSGSGAQKNVGMSNRNNGLTQ